MDFFFLKEKENGRRNSFLLYKHDASEIDCPFLDQPINYSCLHS
jgi:hypothetical protein